jgi:hypothetical protein
MPENSIHDAAASHLVERRQRAAPVDEHADRDRDEVEPEKSSEERWWWTC